MTDQNNLSGKVGLDTTDFKTGITELNRNIRVIESGFRASAAGLGDWSKSASGLEGRIKALNGEIDLQKKKVDAVRGEYERVAKEKGANSRAAQELQIKLNKENETLGKQQSELGNTQSALKEMKDESNKAGKEVKEAGDKTDKAGDQAKNAGGKFAGFSKVMDGVKTAAKIGIATMVGLAAAAVGVGLAAAKLVVDMATSADNISENAEKIGITTDQYQEFSYVADQIGTDVDSVGTAFAKTTKAISEAGKEGSPTADVFKQLGISAVDTNGNLRDTQDVFGDIINSLGNVKNETDREIIAQQLFGKSYQDLIPLINLGKDGLAAMTAEAHKTGAVMGAGTVNALASFSDQLASMKAGLKGVLGTLAGALLPILSIFFTQLTTFINSEKFTTFLQQVIVVLQNVAAWLGTNLPIALQMASNFWTNVLHPAIAAVWGFLSTVVIPWIQGTLVPWLQVVIPAALAVLAGFWTGTLQPAIAAVWAWMSGTLIPFLQNNVVPILQVAIPAAVQFLSDAWTKVLQPAIQAIWKFLSVDMMPVWEALGDLLGVAIPLIITVLKGAWENILLPALRTIWNFITTYIVPIFQKVSEGIGGITGAIETVVGWIQTFTEWLGKIELPDWLTPGSPTPFEMGLRGISEAMADLSNIRLPRMAVELERVGSTGGGYGGRAPAAAPIYITIQGAPADEMKMRRLARYVVDEIKRKQS